LKLLNFASSCRHLHTGDNTTYAARTRWGMSEFCAIKPAA
jgi:hypothetical protein